MRLLVPTATMAQHLQNRMAREGLVFRRSLIQTLSGFVKDFTLDAPEVSPPVLHLMVEEAARRVSRPEFARVVDLPGFCASLARTIEEFASAGCDGARLAACLPDVPLGPPFLAVYREVEAALERRGLAMRARRLERAADRISSVGLGGISTIWMDGFHALPDPELRVIAALGRHADLTLTLGDADLSTAMRTNLEAMGFRFQSTARVRTTPARALVKAAGIEREVEEIARRVLEQAAAGRPFREMGIVVRAAEIYVPLLRSTFERFGIPARFYFDLDLEEHAAVRCLAGAVDAMLSGWDHALTLAALRLAPRFADMNAMDRFDFDVRQQIPNAGIGGMKSLLLDENGLPRPGGAERVIHMLESLASLEEWRGFALGPKDWAARLGTLRSFFRPARPGIKANHEMALEWRGQAAALDGFEEAMDQAAQALDPEREIGLEEFWRAAKTVLRLKPLRLQDGRRNVVHVLSAPEARQWVLPVVFVCGMVEKQFPRFHAQDPFFPDAARCRLNASGIRVRTAADFEREERALFDSAITRATMLVTLSYPEFDARGERNLESLYLEDLILTPVEAPAVRPEPRFAPLPRGPMEILAPGLRDYLLQKTAKLSPTALETFLQCPFQYFSRSILRLKPAPGLPEERLDFLTQGNIVHSVLAEWWQQPQEMAPLFERIFERYLKEKLIPSGYHTERLRNAMLEDLCKFASEDTWPRGSFQSRTEEGFVFALGGSLEISGKIDRLDVAPDGQAYVIDYKYSNAQRIKDRVKNPSLLQAPLYLMAAERVLGMKPAGMFYVGLKSGIEYAGWSEASLMDSPPMPQDWLKITEQRTLQVVDQIRAGRVEVAPANPDNCRFCDFSDVCRIDVRAAESREAGGA